MQQLQPGCVCLNFGCLHGRKRYIMPRVYTTLSHCNIVLCECKAAVFVSHPPGVSPTNIVACSYCARVCESMVWFSAVVHPAPHTNPSLPAANYGPYSRCHSSNVPVWFFAWSTSMNLISSVRILPCLLRARWVPVISWLKSWLCTSTAWKRFSAANPVRNTIQHRTMPAAFIQVVKVRGCAGACRTRSVSREHAVTC